MFPLLIFSNLSVSASHLLTIPRVPDDTLLLICTAGPIEGSINLFLFIKAKPES